MDHTPFLGKDKRNARRLRLRMAVVYQINKPLALRLQIGEKEIIATALDLSEGGIAILTDYNIPENTELMIKFTLFKVNETNHVNFYGPMEIIGQVRSNNAIENNMHRLGICFTNVSDRDKVEITNFVKTALQ